MTRFAEGRKTLAELLGLHERLIIIQTLQQNAFSRRRTAEALGLTRAQLYRRMSILNIDTSVLPRTSTGRPRRKNGIIR